MDKDKRLMEASRWQKLTEGETGSCSALDLSQKAEKRLGLVLMCGAMFSKSLIQFSVDGRGCVPSLLLDLRPSYDGGN